jgi:hypothetical protein
VQEAIKLSSPSTLIWKLRIVGLYQILRLYMKAIGIIFVPGIQPLSFLLRRLKNMRTSCSKGQRGDFNTTTARSPGPFFSVPGDIMRVGLTRSEHLLESTEEEGRNLSSFKAQ